MKHTNKLSIFYALIFVLICTGVAHAQQFDIDEFHIPEGLDLSSSEKERLQNIGTQIREKLVTDLQTQAYDVISPRKSKIRLKRVGIDDIKIDYDEAADRVIFGKLVKTIDYVAVYAYLYDATIPIRSFDKPIEEFVLNRRASQLNDPEEISTAVNEIITGIGLKRSAQPTETQKQEEELKRKEQEKIARQEELKRKQQEQLALQQELEKKQEEERARQEALVQQEKERLAQQKKLDRENNKSTKVCSKVPGTALIVAGGLMGGTGIYLRIKAKNIYDNDYLPNYEEPNARDVLEDARKPNRMAHIVGVGGVLTAGLGAYLWAKCAKKQKDDADTNSLQITPYIEYNALTNTNHVAARVSFNF